MDDGYRGMEPMASKSLRNRKLPTGVEIHGGYLRVAFSINTKRYKESLGLKANEQNIKYAAGLVATVKHEIRIGQFVYSKHFPNSKHATGTYTNVTLGQAMEVFIEDRACHIDRASTKQKKTIGMKFIKYHGANRLLETITPQSLMRYKHKLVSELAGTTANNHITTLNQFFKWLYTMEYLDRNLNTILVKVPQFPRIADPYSVDEIQAVLSNCDVLQHRNLITTAVYAGLRTGELLTLAWEDVDFKNGTILVRRSAYTDRGLTTTKNNKERVVDLLPPALEALKSQMALTLNNNFPAKSYEIEHRGAVVRKEHLRFVFNPKAVRAQKQSDYDYYGHRAMIRIWNACCKKADITYRNPYQMRHTYASWLITYSNINLSYLAEQMGHSDIRMIVKIYGKWLKDSDKRESQRVWKLLEKTHPSHQMHTINKHSVKNTT